jgi:hypothetical protein
MLINTAVGASYLLTPTGRKKAGSQKLIHDIVMLKA